MVITTLTTMDMRKFIPCRMRRVINIVIILSGVSLLFLLIGSLTQALLEFFECRASWKARMERTSTV